MADATTTKMVEATTTPTTPTTTKMVEAIGKGEYVRRSATATKTYKRGEYDRTAKRFELVDCDDISRTVMVKRGTILHVDFTY